MEECLALIRKETLKISKNIKNVKIVRKLKFFEIIHNMIRTGIKKTKREIFYSSPKLFCRQEVVNKMIEEFLKEHGLKMNDLNVAASLKGLFYGETIFHEKTKRYTLSKDLIPDMNDITDIECDFSHVIVIEKDSMMTFIKEVYQKHKKIIPFLLVTGKGYPDYNTTAFLQKLEKKGKKILGLFDLDPHGLNIYKTYRKRLDSIERIGITSEDVHKYKVKKEELLEITDRDLKLLEKMKKESNFGIEFHNDIQFLEGLREKMEIEIFTSQNSRFMIDYLKIKLKNR